MADNKIWWSDNRFQIDSESNGIKLIISLNRSHISHSHMNCKTCLSYIWKNCKKYCCLPSKRFKRFLGLFSVIFCLKVYSPVESLIRVITKQLWGNALFSGSYFWICRTADPNAIQFITIIDDKRLERKVGTENYQRTTGFTTPEVIEFSSVSHRSDTPNTVLEIFSSIHSKPTLSLYYHNNGYHIFVAHNQSVLFQFLILWSVDYSQKLTIKFVAKMLLYLYDSIDGNPFVVYFPITHR